MKSVSLFLLLFLPVSVAAADPEIVTLNNVPDAKRIVPDEPVRAEFSAEMAARYLDTASLAWQHSKDCATCHTNMSYLMARPALTTALKDSGEVREFFESYFLDRWEGGAKEPKIGYNPVVVGTALAFNDAQTTGKLAEATRGTLDMMWTTQRADGSWNWAKCGWAPMEVDDHFGVTLAALTVGIAPDGYAETEAAKAGLAKIRSYLKGDPPKSLHHRMMVAWASLRVAGLMEQAEREKVLGEVLGKQLADGGWSTPGFLADWKEYQRKDGKPHDTETGDAYGTGLAIVVARELGKPADDPALKRGIGWLLKNQRESGKWFTRSPAKDSRHFISNIGSAFAVLALQSCGTLPGWPFEAAVEKPTGLMCRPGKLLFEESFDPGSVSGRWFFREHFTIADGALVRSEIASGKAERVFLKDPEFHNVTIQFDFRLDGCEDLRLVTGSGGHYNSIVQIRPTHFQVNTPVDREADFAPCYLGECAHEFKPGTWYTMTVEYAGDEIVASVDDGHFVVGSHPILDRTRTYFAFQVDRPSVAIDNVSVWVSEKRDRWPESRPRLLEAQNARPPVVRNPAELYEYVFTNLKSRLHRNDTKYRGLIARHAELKSALHTRFPAAFRTHKELQKSIFAERARLRKDDPEFKPLEHAMHRAGREEEAFVRSKFPELDGLPVHQFHAAYQNQRKDLEQSGDVKFAELLAETAARRTELENRFPAAFESVDTLVEERNRIRTGLNGDPEFKRLNKEVADAWQAIRTYENDAEPRLADLEAARKSYLEDRR